MVVQPCCNQSDGIHCPWCLFVPLMFAHSLHNQIPVYSFAPYSFCVQYACYYTIRACFYAEFTVRVVN